MTENKRFALVGNPNSGKTSTFNLLTGANQYVGNWPGVTVERKSGKYVKDKSIIIQDLPGIYSLSPFTPEENVTRDYLLSDDYDVVINLVDATNIERNLYLTTQLIEIGKPVIIALNMTDLLVKQNIFIDTEKLSYSLGVPVVNISALKNQGFDNLVAQSQKATVPQVQVHYDERFEASLMELSNVTHVTNRFELIKIFENDEKIAKKLVIQDGDDVSLSRDDLVFVTNGSITESSTYGSHDKPAPISKELGGSWSLWKNLAEQSNDFGHPEVFYDNLPEKSWFVSATATIKSPEIEPYIERLTNRDLHDHKINTGGIITITDSNWLMSFAVHRQPHFKEQKENETTVWIYGLYSDTKGNFVNKTIVESSGEEITQELLYHLGVPESKIKQLSNQNNINTVPVFMPFITSYFMPRVAGDRPDIVPKGSVNLAFIGNFAESPSNDTVFTTEYSIRTAMESVYTLLEVERAVPEVYGSIYDIRELLKAIYYMGDKKTIDEANLGIPKLAKVALKKKIKGTFIEELLTESKLL